MKLEIARKAFDWMAEVEAAQDYGTKAALAFAKVLRDDLRNNELKCWTGLRPGEAPRVIAGDKDFMFWNISAPLEALINDCALRAFEYEEPEGLDQLAAVLERTLRKTRRLRAKLDAVPASGTAGG